MFTTSAVDFSLTIDLGCEFWLLYLPNLIHSLIADLGISGSMLVIVKVTLLKSFFTIKA